MSADPPARRRLLAHFLRTRRERLRPEQVGLVPPPRGRTPGLRREDVATLARVSLTYYTWLEQARDVTPSEAVVEALGAALRLDEGELTYVRALTCEPERPAGYYEESPELVRRIVTSTDPLPDPVYALDDEGVLLALNASAQRWYAGLRSGTHFLEWFFSAPARGCVLDWEHAAQEVVRRTRLSVVRRPPRPETVQLMAELHRRDREFARWWDGHDVSLQEPTARNLRLPDGSLGRWRLVPMRPVLANGASVVLHLAESADAP